jgi:hypothetical protein
MRVYPPELEMDGHETKTSTFPAWKLFRTPLFEITSWFSGEENRRRWQKKMRYRYSITDTANKMERTPAPMGLSWLFKFYEC